MNITRNLFAAFVTTVATLGCGKSEYLKAVTAYAETAGNGTSSLGELSDSLVSICRQRATAHYINRRLEDPEAMTKSRWETYYTLPKEADGVLSWQDYCASVGQTGENYEKLVALLSAYVKAMKVLADQESWDGSDLNDLLSNLSELSGSSTQLGKDLAALAPSAKQLVSFLVAKYAESEAQELAKSADPPIQVILTGMSAYLTATIKDVVTPAAKERAEAIDMIEKSSVWTTPGDASRVISFTSYAQATDDDISTIKVKFADYDTLIIKLKAGQTVLATVPPKKESVKAILTAATNILVALNSVRAQAKPAG
ncbi:MAG: hypothetical protein WDO69_06550 [Pseudomonadota bacterium]